jgi:hypothetical protein
MILDKDLFTIVSINPTFRATSFESAIQYHSVQKFIGYRQSN